MGQTDSYDMGQGREGLHRTGILKKWLLFPFSVF